MACPVSAGTWLGLWTRAFIKSGNWDLKACGKFLGGPSPEAGAVAVPLGTRLPVAMLGSPDCFGTTGSEIRRRRGLWPRTDRCPEWALEASCCLPQAASLRATHSLRASGRCPSACSLPPLRVARLWSPGPSHAGRPRSRRGAHPWAGQSCRRGSLWGQSCFSLHQPRPLRAAGTDQAGFHHPSLPQALRQVPQLLLGLQTGSPGLRSSLGATPGLPS